jgi:hypothetical protein
MGDPGTISGVTVDLRAALSFAATHARVLDRRRLHLLLGEGDRDAVLAALDAYRNPDGGYGWGLEPDLRSPESQPASALHAFEVFAEAVPATTPRAAQLCEWLASISRPDGGLPFALPLGDPAGTAPWWAQADPTTSSLQITAAVAGNAHRVARHDATVANHPWLAAATEYCLAAIRAVEAAPPAYELSFALQFLDAVSDTRPEAAALLAHLGRHVPADGTMRVEGGTDEEMLRPLDVAPDPDRPVRSLFAPPVIAADVDRLAQQQQPDGGWPVSCGSARRRLRRSSGAGT